MSETGLLSAYLERLGYQGAVEPSLATLKSLHRAHVQEIPWENLEIHLGRPMELADEPLRELILGRKRGGYCFQMNKVFSQALDAIGFEYRRHAGRVWVGGTELPPASHQLQIVTIDAEEWLADVGFGAGLLEPVPLRLDEEFRQGFQRFRLRDHGDLGILLQRKHGDVWLDQYSFERQVCHPIDYQFANYYLSTSSESFFVQHRTCTRYREHDLVALFDDTFRFYSADGVREERIEDGPRYLEALRSYLNLELEPGVALRPLAKPAT